MNDLLFLLKLTTNELKQVLYNYLIDQNMNPVFEDGFIYSKGDIPVLLVAHMDTIFNYPPKRLYYDKEFDKLFSLDGGIGADDRSGIYAIIKILEDFKPHVLFTEDEEIGALGARKAVSILKKPDVKYIIEFDRKGSNDCVFYDCENIDFINYIEKFNFNSNYGSFTDISILAKFWNIAAVNISCGYYNEHTHLEYLKYKELINNINRVKEIIKEHNEVNYFDYYIKKLDKVENYKIKKRT